MNKSKSHINDQHNGCCEYCGSPTTIRCAEGIYKNEHANELLCVCSKYPECDAYVHVHPGTTTPMGNLANSKLRRLRHEAHLHFDQLYQSGHMTRDDAYRWLAALIQAPRSQAHIGHLREYYCQLVIDESKKMLRHRRRMAGGGIHAVK